MLNFSFINTPMYIAMRSVLKIDINLSITLNLGT